MKEGAPHLAVGRPFYYVRVFTRYEGSHQIT